MPCTPATIRLAVSVTGLTIGMSLNVCGMPGFAFRSYARSMITLNAGESRSTNGFTSGSVASGHRRGHAQDDGTEECQDSKTSLAGCYARVKYHTTVRSA